MLKLTKTESIILDALKKGPKTKYDLEELIDHSKEYSESFIKVIVSNINKKAGKRVIEGFNNDGYYKYRLIDDSIEYQMVKGIEGVLEEIKEMKLFDQKLACETCAFKANYNNRYKYIIMIVIVLMILCLVMYMIGYDIGYNHGFDKGSPVVELNCEDVQGVLN